MRWHGLVVGAGALAVMAGPSSLPARQAPATPVVLELFTAQGCGSCPDANAMVAELAGREDVIALTYAVDYWDYLGWSDTFARPEFTRRQRDYQAALRLSAVYTPQIVLDGQRELAGLDRDEVEDAVREEAAQPDWPPDMAFFPDGERVAIGSGRVPDGGAEVWLVRYRPGTTTVRVGAGENRGESVDHANVVRELVRLGGWSGRPQRFALPAPGEADLESVVLVQAVSDRAILAAARP